MGARPPLGRVRTKTPDASPPSLHLHGQVHAFGEEFAAVDLRHFLRFSPVKEREERERERARGEERERARERERERERARARARARGQSERRVRKGDSAHPSGARPSALHCMALIAGSWFHRAPAL